MRWVEALERLREGEYVVPLSGGIHAGATIIRLRF